METAINPCGACNEKRIHAPAEWSEFHRYAGHGFSEGLGWSHPDLEAAANERADRPLAALDDNASAQ
jgi:hypothetical protein